MSLYSMHDISATYLNKLPDLYPEINIGETNSS